jgi:hypothetical protein
VGDGCFLWEPTPWAMGVAHALKTIAHRGGLPLHDVTPTPEPGPIFIPFKAHFSIL